MKLFIGLVTSLIAFGGSKLPEHGLELTDTEITLKIAVEGTHRNYAASLVKTSSNSLVLHQVLIEEFQKPAQLRVVTTEKFYDFYSQFSKFYNGVIARIPGQPGTCAFRIRVTLTENKKKTFDGILCTQYLTPEENRAFSEWYKKVR